MRTRTPLPRLALALLALAAFGTPARAGAPRIRGILAESGLTILALEPSGQAVSSGEQKFTLTPAPATGQLIVLADDTSVRGPVVLGIKSGRKVLPVAKARAKGLCAKADTRAVMRFKTKGRKTLNLRKLAVAEHVVYPTRKVKKAMLDTATGLARVDDDCVPVGAGRLGVTGDTDGAAPAVAAASLGGGGEDPDGDGLPNAVDADDDGDGILDNDDSDSRPGPGAGLPPDGGETPQSFWVFSNFHHEFEDSLNANAMTVTKDMVDAALTRNAGLAFQVVGDGTLADVELDCGTLPYCVAGGTGRTAEPYPNGLEFPEDVDADGDGLGTITPGPTGDFQYRPFGDAPAGHPAADILRAGDVYLERYTDGTGAEVEVPGMLNFMFHTTPAVKTVETGVRTYTPTYPVAPDGDGTRQHPFHVPTTGDATVTLTVWRPQRAGIPGTGEAAFMDMGNLRLVTNLPNGPCDSTGMSCGSGPGLCPPSVYTTTDPNLSIVGDGLQDALGDVPADPANTFTYTIDLSACVTTVPGETWDADETLMVPVQMMNVYGDNAAQNIFFVRDDS